MKNMYLIHENNQGAHADVGKWWNSFKLQYKCCNMFTAYVLLLSNLPMFLRCIMMSFQMTEYFHDIKPWEALETI